MITAILRRGSIIALLSIFVALQYAPMVSSAQGGLPADQKLLYQQGINYFDLNTCGADSSVTPPSTGGIPPGPVYIMGDSITDLSKDAYTAKFTGDWSATVNGLVSRHIASSPPSPSGLDQLDQDKDTIGKAHAIVVGLGTNDSGGSAASIKSDVRSAMAKVKQYNTSSAPVFWVNILDTRSDADSKKTNQAITDGVGSDATVIDWYSEAKSKADTGSFSGGVHPTKQADIDLLVNLVYNSVTGASTASANATPMQAKTSVPTSFTLKDKIGQLLFLEQGSSSGAAALEKQYNIGGFIFTASASEYDKSTIASIKTASSISPFIGIDEEGGQVDKLSAGIPSAKQMGSMSTDAVKKKGEDVGKKMADLGITIDFAPVLDLDNGKSNGAISRYDRAFSSSANTVADKAGAFAQGLEAANITPTFKHFPGLGSANVNTDTGPATTDSLSSLKSSDLKPYASLLQSDSKAMVMVGNQKVPGLTGGEPASMSKAAYDLLRNDYNYKGVILTDDIGHAKAIQPRNATQAVIQALKAGADMPVVYVDSDAQVGSMIDAVAQAVNDGTISKTQIDDSVSKVVALKNNGQTQPVTTPAATTCGCPTAAASAASAPANPGDAVTDGTLSAVNEYKFLTDNFGLSPIAASAITANAIYESGGDAVKLTLKTNNPNPSSGANGIHQWLDRLPALKAFAAKKHKPFTDLAVQLDYLAQELRTSEKASLDAVKAETDIDAATTTFERLFERSTATSSYPARQAIARKVLAAFGPGGTGSPGAPAEGTTPACADPASTPNSSDISAYKDPLRDVQNLVKGRIDQGVDYTGSGKVYAMGKGKVVNVNNDGWKGIGRTPTFIVYQLSDGPAKDKYVFFAEGCTPKVSIGDSVTSDTVICDMLSGANSIETGWADGSRLGDAAAHDLWVGHDSTAFYTAYGENFSQLLVKLGAPAGTIQSGAQKLGSLPSEWPTW